MKKIIALFLLIPAIAFAGGLYQEVTQPISGTVQEYIRFPRIEASNPLNGDITMEFTSEKVKLFPTGDVLKTFNRRTKLKISDYVGKQLPLYSPQTGEQIGTYTPEQYYAMTYSMSILSENAADNICYTTNGQVICP